MSVAEIIKQMGNLDKFEPWSGDYPTHWHVPIGLSASISIGGVKVR
jgi:hypothetical protein